MHPRTEYVRQWKKSKEKPCPLCNQAMIQYDSKSCRRCSRLVLHDIRTMAEVKYIKHRVSSAFALVRAAARVRCPPSSCACCGYDKHTEVAHITALASFPDTATVSEVNAPDNLVRLCPNCHWEFDNNVMSEDFLRRMRK